MTPKYVPTIAPITDIINGLDIGEYLAHMERQGMTLVAIVPMFSHILIIHRTMVPVAQEIEDAGPAEVTEGASDDTAAPSDNTFDA
jgi:hypothetical protein